MNTEELLNARFDSAGNEFLFCLAVAMKSRYMKDPEKNDCLFYAMLEELEGLAFVGYLDDSHRETLKNNGFVIQFSDDYRSLYLEEIY